MRFALVILALAAFACNALVGFNELTRDPNPAVRDPNGDDDDGDDVVGDDDDDTDGSASSSSGSSGSSSSGGLVAACDPTKDFAAPVPLAGAVNTTDFENSPSLTDDELTLVFQRSGNGDKHQLMMATRTAVDQPFANVTPLPLTASNLSYMPTITRDGLALFWSEIRTLADSMDIFTATRSTTAASFTNPRATGMSNQAVDEQDPIVSADGDEMFFSSSEGGSANSRQIFRATRDLGEYKNAQKVKELASNADDEGIALSKDGLTIYFGSTRAGGKGLLDVWMATRPSRTGKFGAPVIVPSVNTVSVDWPTFVSADGCRLYLGSEIGGNGDLYVATRPR